MMDETGFVSKLISIDGRCTAVVIQELYYYVEKYVDGIRLPISGGPFITLEEAEDAAREFTDCTY